VLFKAYYDVFREHGTEDVVLYLTTLVYIVKGIESDSPFNTSYLKAHIDEWARKELHLPKGMEDLPPFCMLVDDFTEEELVSFYRIADAFVLPTRGEGWGLPLIQAMAMGLPTIGTGWGGQMEFMNQENSYLIDYDLQPVTAPKWMYDVLPNTEWAEPKVESLASLMKHVYHNRGEAAQRGKLARKWVVERFSEEAVAKVVDQRLEEIRHIVVENRKMGIRRRVPPDYKKMGPYETPAPLPSMTPFPTPPIEFVELPDDTDPTPTEVPKEIVAP
jgi:glycosyltransferase involved in cell wall biosynthesis